MLLIFKFFSTGVILNKRLLNSILRIHLILTDIKRCGEKIVLVELDQLLNWLSHETPLAADQYEKQRSVIFLYRVPSLIIQIKREKGYKKF